MGFTSSIFLRIYSRFLPAMPVYEFPWPFLFPDFSEASIDLVTRLESENDDRNSAFEVHIETRRQFFLVGKDSDYDWGR